MLQYIQDNRLGPEFNSTARSPLLSSPLCVSAREFYSFSRIIPDEFFIAERIISSPLKFFFLFLFLSKGVDRWGCQFLGKHLLCFVGYFSWVRDVNSK